MMNIKRDYRFASGDFSANDFNINSLILSDDSHRVGYNAHTGRLQLSHILSSAGIILIRLTGLISAPGHLSGSTPIDGAYYSTF
jgi:hypothetical protein